MSSGIYLFFRIREKNIRSSYISPPLYRDLNIIIRKKKIKKRAKGLYKRAMSLIDTFFTNYQMKKKNTKVRKMMIAPHLFELPF